MWLLRPAVGRCKCAMTHYHICIQFILSLSSHCYFRLSLDFVYSLSVYMPSVSMPTSVYYHAFVLWTRGNNSHSFKYMSYLINLAGWPKINLINYKKVTYMYQFIIHNLFSYTATINNKVFQHSTFVQTSFDNLLSNHSSWHFTNIFLSVFLSIRYSILIKQE